MQQDRLFKLGVKFALRWHHCVVFLVCMFVGQAQSKQATMVAQSSVWVRFKLAVSQTLCAWYLDKWVTYSLEVWNTTLARCRKTENGHRSILKTYQIRWRGVGHHHQCLQGKQFCGHYKGEIAVIFLTETMQSIYTGVFGYKLVEVWCSLMSVTVYLRYSY